MAGGHGNQPMAILSQLLQSGFSIGGEIEMELAWLAMEDGWSP